MRFYHKCFVRIPVHKVGAEMKILLRVIKACSTCFVNLVAWGSLIVEVFNKLLQRDNNSAILHIRYMTVVHHWQMSERLMELSLAKRAYVGYCNIRRYFESSLPFIAFLCRGIRLYTLYVHLTCYTCKQTGRLQPLNSQLNYGQWLGLIEALVSYARW